jgi:hypothetical protein
MIGECKEKSSAGNRGFFEETEAFLHINVKTSISRLLVGFNEKVKIRRKNIEYI